MRRDFKFGEWKSGSSHSSGLFHCRQSQLADSKYWRMVVWCHVQEPWSKGPFSAVSMNQSVFGSITEEDRTRKIARSTVNRTQLDNICLFVHKRSVIHWLLVMNKPRKSTSCFSPASRETYACGWFVLKCKWLNSCWYLFVRRLKNTYKYHRDVKLWRCIRMIRC